jgi:hypothetical protein
MLILILLYRRIYIKQTTLEGLSNIGSKIDTTKKEIYKGTFNSTFNGRMAIDDQYFYDKLFDDVVYYPNQYENDYNLNDINMIGWEKCKMECTGHCVEYGITGNAYCFPY